MLFSCNVFAQKEFNSLDWKADVSLNTWLVQKVHEQYASRRIELNKALKSVKTTEDYIQNVQRKYLELLGSFPKRTALNAKITGTIHRDGYKIEKIIYESFPDHHITSNLYIPQGKGPFPSVLLFCGHEDVSKATESYQKTAILFVKNGFVVFVIDPVSQSERHQLTDENGKPLTRGGTTEHTLLNEVSNLFGGSTPKDELWDNIRGLDYLETRAEVDTSKIGCIGNSGGAMQAIYFAGYEKRVKLFAICSFLMSRERALELTGPSDGCSQMPNEGKAQLEMSDFLIVAAPKPLLVLAGRYDFIDYIGTLAAYDDLKKVYSILGEPQKLKLFTYDDGHGISKPKREAGISWFRQWFYKDTGTVTEGNLQTMSDKELFATATGQVNKDFPAEITIVKRNRNLFDSFHSVRKKFLLQDRITVKNKIREILSINDNIKKQDSETVGKINKSGIIFHKIILRKENEIPLPILIVYPASPKNLVIWFHDGGKNKIADSSRIIKSYLDRGSAIVLADLRGMGETEDKSDLNDPKYYNKEYRNAMLSLHIGKCLVGQRVEDIQTVLQYLEADSRLKNLPVEINAFGMATVPALHAALFNPNISQLNLYRSIRSYKEILEKPLEKDWYSYVLPDVLKYYDLPDLVNIVGERKVVFVR